MSQIERRSESKIVQHKPDDWEWDGDYRYSVVAKRLREAGITACLTTRCKQTADLSISGLVTLSARKASRMGVAHP